MINHDSPMCNVQTTKLIDFRSARWWWWSMVTCVRWLLFRVVRHWRGGVIVRIRIITTFNLPSMYSWRGWTMNINDWCSWCCHNLELNEKIEVDEESEATKRTNKWNEHYFLLLLLIRFLFSLVPVLFLSLRLSVRPSLSLFVVPLSISFEVCVHHLWLKKDRWISTYLLLDFVLM